MHKLAHVPAQSLPAKLELLERAGYSRDEKDGGLSPAFQTRWITSMCSPSSEGFWDFRTLTNLDGPSSLYAAVGVLKYLLE